MTERLKGMGSEDPSSTGGVSTSHQSIPAMKGHQPVVGLIGASTSSVSAPIATVPCRERLRESGKNAHTHTYIYIYTLCFFQNFKLKIRTLQEFF